MKAVLLSAGFGERLRPLTNNLPKVLVPVNNKPCLQYNIENLKEQGINEFLINTHYLPERIKEYFGDGSMFGVQIKYSYEPKILGTSGALNNFKNELTETFIVIYGDAISNINLKEALLIHKKNNAEATIILDKLRSQKGKGVVIAKNNKVISFIEKPEREIPRGLINSGVYILEPSILKKIPQGFSDFGKDILPNLAEEGKVFCIEHKGYLFDIGNLENLAEAEEFFKNQK
ncbi:MAG: nucleotidyltransferase family protein [Nanoarchaeota archaeon]|nr:nucleotidyltransferase family protein [Nanoarchaeota archaeon]